MKRFTHFAVNVIGCIVVLTGFFLPWYSANSLPWYFFYYTSYVSAASGWRLWLGGRAIDLAFAPGVLPEFFRFIYLLPLAALLTIILNIMDFTRKWQREWWRVLADAVLLFIMGVILFPPLVFNMSSQVGLWTCFIGWLLIFASAYLHLTGLRSKFVPGDVIAQPIRRKVLGSLVGLVGLTSVGVSGFLLWKSWRAHNALAIYGHNRPRTRQFQANNSLLNVSWSPDGKSILICSQQGSAQSWDIFPGGINWTYQPSRATAGAWSPDGQHLALADLISAYDRTPTVVNPITGVTEAEGPFSTQIGNFYVQALAWSPDSQSIAVAGPDPTTIVPEKLIVQFWYPFTGAIGKTYTAFADNEVVRVGTLAWSPDGQYLAGNYFGFPSNSAVSTQASTSSVFLWNAQSGVLLFQDQTFQYPLMDGPEGYGGKFLSWSPNSHYLALANHAIVQILEISSQKVLLTYTGHASQVQALAYSPDGKYIASSSFDWTVQVWEVATGNLHFIYQGHTDVVRDVSWSPDGRFLVSCGDDGTAQVWQPEYNLFG